MDNKDSFSGKVMDFSKSFPNFEHMVSLIEITDKRLNEEKERKEKERIVKLNNHINFTYNCFMAKIADDIHMLKQELETYEVGDENRGKSKLGLNGTIYFEYYYALCDCEEKGNPCTSYKYIGNKEAKQVLDMVIAEMKRHGYPVGGEYVGPNADNNIKIRFCVTFSRNKNENEV